MLARALIVLLSVLNLGVAAWWIAHDPPPAKAMPQVPPGVARLLLVQEGAPGPAPTAVEQVAPSTAADASATSSVADVVAPAAPQCFSFGPFASKDAGTKAAAKLRPQVQKLSEREQPAPAAARGWRVYLPPLPSLEQAQTTAQRIGAAGFSDFLVVREGAEANSIALGRFSSEDAANKHADALNAAGFAAQAEAVGEAGKATNSLWLDVVADAAFDPRRAQAAIAAGQYRKADCAAR
ncbi:SPOR domain-containing protein [Lysobacter tyrosinilyticus]